MKRITTVLLLAIFLTACPSQDDQRRIADYLRRGAFTLAANLLDKQLVKLDTEITSIGDENVGLRFREYVQEFREIKHQLAGLQSAADLSQLAQSILSLYGSARCDIQKLPDGQIKASLTKLFNRLDKYLLPFLQFMPNEIGGERIASQRLNFGICP
jgi:hypothetical protein